MRRLVIGSSRPSTRQDPRRESVPLSAAPFFRIRRLGHWLLSIANNRRGRIMCHVAGARPGAYRVCAASPSTAPSLARDFRGGTISRGRRVIGASASARSNVGPGARGRPIYHAARAGRNTRMPFCCASRTFSARHADHTHRLALEQCRHAWRQQARVGSESIALCAQ